MSRAAGMVLFVVCLITGYALWPVCVPLSSEQVAAFQPPITERTDSFLFGRVFQQREGQWHQCKTRIARALFF